MIIRERSISLVMPTLKNLKRISDDVTEKYKNLIIENCNESCLRMSVNNGVYDWHFHPNSDELFIVIEGELHIELGNAMVFHLSPMDYLKIPKGVVHRTFSNQRTVNLTYELKNLESVFTSKKNAEIIPSDYNVLNLQQIGAGIEEPYKNIVMETINEDVMRLGVSSSIYNWHRHPNSDELFMGIEGTFLIESHDHSSKEIGAMDVLLIKKNIEHRMVAKNRKVSVTFESGLTCTEKSE